MNNTGLRKDDISSLQCIFALPHFGGCLKHPFVPIIVIEDNFQQQIQMKQDCCSERKSFKIESSFLPYKQRSISFYAKFHT